MNATSDIPFVQALLQLYQTNSAKAFNHLNQCPRILTAEPQTQTDFLNLGDLWQKETQSRTLSRTLVVSYPDSKLCPKYFTTRLEHSDKIFVHSSEAIHPFHLPNQNLPSADGFIIHAKNKHASTSEQIILGMRTADCLTWVSLFETPDQTLVAFAHLGWRSFAKGLHFKMIDEIAQHVNLQTWKKSARHYLGPSIFGRSYPCHIHDVGKELENLQSLRSRNSLDPTNNQIGLFHTEAWQASAQHLLHIDLNAGHCFPDLQLLCLLDIAAAGICLERILVHRVNTAESLIYPSYRHALEKQNDRAQRLLTAVFWNV